jgi:hypothetical protein
MNPLTQIRLNKLPAKHMVNVLSDVLDNPLKLGVDNTTVMSALALGVMANRLEAQASNPLSIVDYSTLSGLIRECERFTFHPLIPQYTTCIFALSYYEWRNRLHGIHDK